MFDINYKYKKDGKKEKEKKKKYFKSLQFMHYKAVPINCLDS